MRDRIIPSLTLAFLLPLAIAMSACVLVVGAPMWAVLVPLIWLSDRLNERRIRRLLADGEDTEDITGSGSSEEFSAAANVTGGFLRLIAWLPLFPAAYMMAAVDDLWYRARHPRLGG